MDHNLEFIKQYFSKPNKGFQPMIILKTNRNHRIAMMVADLPGDSKQRHKMFHDILLKVGQDKKLKEDHGLVFAIFMMTEAWLRGQTEKGEKIALPIADQPTKTEVMISSGMTIDGRVNMATYPMLRSSPDGVVVLDTKHAIVSPYDPKTKGNQAVSFILQEAFRGYVEGMKED